MKKTILVLCLFGLFTIFGCGVSHQEDYSHYKIANITMGAFMNEGTGYYPRKQILYPLVGCIVFQKTPQGYILEGTESASPIFLETNEELPQGINLYGRWAYYIGDFQYTNIGGFNRRIYAFRLVPRRQEK